MTPDIIGAYLDRLGIGGTVEPSAAWLAELQAAHLHQVPFENLSIHLGEPIELDSDASIDKMVRQGRGGFCYELNSAFAALLTELGFEVSLLSACVALDEERFGAPFDHLALAVGCPADDDPGPWLADVGFGDSPLWPLWFGDPGSSPANSQGRGRDPLGSARLVALAGGEVDLIRDGQRRYRVDPRPRRLHEFREMCWYHQTSSRSPFARDTICTRRIPGGRVTVAGRRRILTVDGRRHEEAIVDDDQLLAVYRDDFDLHLDRVPAPARSDGGS